MIVLYWFFFLLFVYCVGRVAKRIAGSSFSEWLIITFIVFVGSIIPSGFVLSALNLTGNVYGWIVGNFLTLSIQYFFWNAILPPSAPFSVRLVILNRGATFVSWFRELSPYLKFVFGVMLLTLTIVGITNLILVIFTVPNEWDSMTGHLNRAVRYIQRGSMAHFGGTNWNMDTYPRSPTTIQIYCYLISGKIETAFKLLHHLSFWITLVSVFAIAQRIGRNLSASFFCALAYSMFLNFLMQAVTTETDIVLTAYLGSLLYFLFSFYNTREDRYLYLAGMTFGIALGHKVTFALLFPSVFVIMLYSVFIAPDFKTFFGRFWKLAIAIVFSVMIFVLPTGYVRNIQVFGHPIGPPVALKHQSVERFGGAANLFEEGSRNVVRYVYDFCNLDGLRNAQWGYNINTSIRKPLVWLEDKLRMRLDESKEYSIVPFVFQRRFDFYNANPYWGIFGFALVLPIVVLVLFRVLWSRVHWFLSIAIVLHFIGISYSAVYDPFKGRYFMETGLFGVLFLLLIFSHHRLSILKPRRRIWRFYIAFIVILACLSALMSVYLNERCLPIAAFGRQSAMTTERIRYQTFARPDITSAYLYFDSIVPANATVALATINDDFEYPLYGRDLSRKLISINPFGEGLRKLPSEADYLFYARSVINDTSQIRAMSTDIRLGSDTTMKNLIVKGEDYYLRKLR
jgi:hypothetical protein